MHDQVSVVGEILGRVLGRSALGPADDFFVAGGNSALALEALEALSSRTGMSLTIFEFYSDPTPAGVSGALTRPVAADPWLPAPVRIDRSGDLPFTLRQETRLRRYGLELPPWRSAVQAAFMIDGDIDLGALGPAANRIVGRHEALRTYAYLDDDGPHQRLSSAHVPVDIQVSTLAADAVEAYLAEFARQPFDLGAGPLIRLGAARIASRNWLLTISMDHFVADARALEVVISELTTMMLGKEPGPPPVFHYADFAAWQRKLVSGEAYRELAGYWKSAVGGSVPQLALPRSAGANGWDRHDGAVLERPLPAATMSVVTRFAQRQRVPLFAMLAGAWALVLTREAGHGPVSMLSPCTSRVQPGFEDMIGDLSNSVPLVFDIPPDITFRQLAEVSSVVWDGMLEHGMFPYDEIMKVAAGELPVPEEISEVFFSVGQVSRFELPGMATRPVATAARKSFFELSHFVLLDGDSATSRSMFKPSLFAHGHVMRMLELYDALLMYGSSNPDAPALAGADGQYRR